MGGQRVPQAHFEIRFDQHYDLFCSFYPEEPTVFRGCTILGFTGRGGESLQSGRSSVFGGYSDPSGSGSAVTLETQFDHWLVLRLSDGRLAYIPPAAVKYFEETPAQGR